MSDFSKLKTKMVLVSQRLCLDFRFIITRVHTAVPYTNGYFLCLTPPIEGLINFSRSEVIYHESLLLYKVTGESLEVTGHEWR